MGLSSCIRVRRTAKAAVPYEVGATGEALDVEVKCDAAKRSVEWVRRSARKTEA